MPTFGRRRSPISIKHLFWSFPFFGALRKDWSLDLEERPQTLKVIRAAHLAVPAWVLRMDRIINGFKPGIIANFGTFLTSRMAFAKIDKEVFSILNKCLSWPFTFGYLGRIESYMGLDPESLPNSQFSDFYDGIRRVFEGGVLRN